MTTPTTKLDQDGMLVPETTDRCPAALRFVYRVVDGDKVELLINENKLKKNSSKQTECDPVYFKGEWIAPPLPDGYGIDFQQAQYFIYSQDVGPVKCDTRPPPPRPGSISKMLWPAKLRYWFDMRRSKYYTCIPENFFSISSIKARDSEFNGLDNQPRLLRTKPVDEDCEWDVENRGDANDGHENLCADIHFYWQLLIFAAPISKETAAVSVLFKGFSKFHYDTLKNNFKELDELIKFVYGKYFDDEGVMHDVDDDVFNGEEASVACSYI
jgi:hypothetical protein